MNEDIDQTRVQSMQVAQGKFDPPIKKDGDPNHRLQAIQQPWQRQLLRQATTVFLGQLHWDSKPMFGGPSSLCVPCSTVQLIAIDSTKQVLDARRSNGVVASPLTKASKSPPVCVGCGWVKAWANQSVVRSAFAGAIMARRESHF